MPASLLSVRSRVSSSTGSDTLETGILRAAPSAGSVELACQHPANRPDLITRARARALRELLESHNVSPIVHTDSSVNTAELYPGIRDAVRRHMDGYLDLCTQVGSRTLIVHGGLTFSDDPSAAVDASVAMLGEWASDAASVGITLVLENMNALPAEAEIRYLGCTGAEVRHLIDTVDSPALRACVDLGHAHLLDEGVAGFVASVAGHIGHVQITDNDGVLDHHLALGTGTLDIDAALVELHAAGYRGALAVELDGVDDRVTSLPVLARAIAAFEDRQPASPAHGSA
ncbi:sugar phosphate isomerase/epimerase [Microbacterium sp. cx-55]|uniref:sugar phosphate isomerase/epimerase family protein n=1 Tax=Microbacterium sp. cx-55 TaxID=2875948 RepID=UPI001CC1B557|nr:sugar phosphate isomerase/epimerase family protein [Microbacterium sp. cx-55]MBZ4486734.1 sugar phosphate isomerase/epimerase [Microbacterium sp. cx-55]UGB36308.1 sugar phosphate isomerase/epimerase [Microbacterium sp. cx-55]